MPQVRCIIARFLKREIMNNEEEDYDGFWFLPHEDDGLQLSFFTFAEEFAGGTPVDSSDNGDTYHLAFFKEDEEGMPLFDDAFEAILGDPQNYIRNLNGSGLYGCVVRKTTKSGKWFEDYLASVVGSVIIDRVKSIVTLK